MKWRVKMSWRCWTSLKWKNCYLWHVWGDGKLLFLSLLVKIWHDMGSTCSRHRAYPLTALFSDFVGPTDRLSTVVWVLGCSLFGLQLLLSINPIAFRSNNHVMNIFRAVGFMWVSFGKLLFLSLLVKIWHDMGSTCSRHRAHPLTASFSDFVGPTDRLSTVVWVLGCSLFGLQLLLSINPIAFRSNNHVMNIFRAVGFMWVSFGLSNGAKTP